MDVADYYRSLSNRRMAIMNDCMADSDAFALQVASHNGLKEFELMLAAVGGPESTIIQQACREFQYSLEAVLFGQYRHAFSSLRLSLELFFAAFYFSAHQMHMRLWLTGHSDIFWATINDPDKGVLSHNFLKAFRSDLGSYRVQYMKLASTVYRECSEYVHGNPSTHDDVSLAVSYEAGKLRAFHDKVETVRLCVAFAFAARYLKDLDATNKRSVKALMLDNFGSLLEIRIEFGAGST